MSDLPIPNYDRNEVLSRGFAMANTGPRDENLIVLFFNKSVLNVAKSKLEGKRIYESREFIKIQAPGETLNIVERPIQEGDKQRFPRQWDRFSQGKEQRPDGIPVSLLFPSNPAISDMLAGYNIHTIEQLADLSGHGISTIGMGAQEWVNHAKRYMEHANKGVDFHRFNAAIEEKDRQIATLQRQVNEMAQHINRVMKLAPEPPQNFDAQSAQINALKGQEIFNPPPQTFTADVTPPKRKGWPLGKPRKPKEPQDGTNQ